MTLVGRDELTRVVATARRLLLVAALAVFLLPPADTAYSVANFGDVAAGRYFTGPVQWMVDNGITTGVSATCYAPSDVVDRGQAAAFIWRMQGRPDPGVRHPFTDIVRHWQQDAVSWLFNNMITTGTSNTTYSPDDPVTRGQIAAFLHRLAGHPGPGVRHPFTDIVKHWQQDAVSWLFNNMITTGTSNTTYSPDDPVTRGQIAAFLYRFKGSPAVEIDRRHPKEPLCADQVPGPPILGPIFAPRVVYSSNQAVNNLVAGDVTGDGRLDLVGTSGNASPRFIGDSANSIVVLPGLTDGRFGEASNLRPIERVNDLSLTDLDADGLLDLTVTRSTPNARSGIVSIFFGALGLGWGEQLDLEFHNVGSVIATEAIDIDDDGMIDLVSLVDFAPDLVSIRRGLGGREFLPAEHHSIGTSNAGGTLGPGDFNSDGYDDVLVWNCERVVIFSGQTLGSMLMGESQDTVECPSSERLAITDIDGDNDLDAVMTQLFTIDYVLGDGKGGLSEVIGTGVSLWNARALDVGDFNKDGAIDLAVTEESGFRHPSAIAILLNGGSAEFTTRTELASDFPFSIAVCDFDRDGWPDVASGQRSRFDGEISVHLNHRANASSTQRFMT